MNDKTETLKSVLRDLEISEKFITDLAINSILALSGLKPSMSWKEATNDRMRIHDIILFIRNNYSKSYAENSRETIRKSVMHPLREAAFIEDNADTVPTNSPKYGYKLTLEMLKVIQSIGSESYQETLSDFKEQHESLIDLYTSKRNLNKIPITVNEKKLEFSSGKHNKLQKNIIEEFASRFVPGAECLYIGDTTDRDLVKNVEKLHELGFEITLHDKMPDVVLYQAEMNWIYFIEAVVSSGAITPQRMRDLDGMTKNVTAGRIYVTSFPDFKTYKKFANNLAWETEVWIAEEPDHMIHLNGHRMLFPR